MNPISPNPSEAILAMQERHRQTLLLNGILDKIIVYTAAELAEDAFREISEGYPVVLGSTAEDTTHLFVAFQNEAGLGPGRELSSRVARIGAIVAGHPRPNVFMGITDVDVSIVRSLYDDALYHQLNVAHDYNPELGL